MACATCRAWRVLASAVFVEHQKVRLDRLVAAVARLAGGSLEIVDGAHRGGVDHLAVEIFGAARPDHAAARPVDRDALAPRPAEQLIDWHAQRLAFDVEAGVENSGGGVLVETARYRARERIERGIKAADRTRVLPDQELTHALDRGGDAGASVFPELRPAGKPLIGADLQERIDLPTAIDMKFFELGDLHSAPRFWRFPACHFSPHFGSTWKGARDDALTVALPLQVMRLTLRLKRLDTPEDAMNSHRRLHKRRLHKMLA